MHVPLNCIVNQETAAELLSFFQRIFPRTAKPVEKAQVQKKSQASHNLSNSLQSQQVSMGKYAIFV